MCMSVLRGERASAGGRTGGGLHSSQEHDGLSESEGVHGEGVHGQ